MERHTCLMIFIFIIHGVCFIICGGYIIIHGDLFVVIFSLHEVHVLLYMLFSLYAVFNVAVFLFYEMLFLL